MKRYLKCDYTGEASGIEYGKKGDEVQFINERDGVALVEGKELFHIRLEKLSEDPVPKEKSVLPPIVIKPKPIKRKK